MAETISFEKAKEAVRELTARAEEMLNDPNKVEEKDERSIEEIYNSIQDLQSESEEIMEKIGLDLWPSDGDYSLFGTFQGQEEIERFDNEIEERRRKK